MRGGLIRWKRGVGNQGVSQAVAYAFEGVCDAHVSVPAGVDALGHYADAEAGVTRFTVDGGRISHDRLGSAQLASWVDGRDPLTGERRGRELASPDADLVLDGTINAPKSYSLAALINPELSAEFEALQDRLRDRVISTWQRELNARRGAAGRVREGIQRLEVVELQHRRSRSLDPHVHRHLWLNVRVLGNDGRWSNVDSRVAMKLHTVINAEGELAARTDPEWIAALARHGYTLDGDGEIRELAHAVRPLSRRATQIESNRAAKIAEWEQEHPGEEPSAVVLRQIDQWAWAADRPNKPKHLDEDDWEQQVREELRTVDPKMLGQREPVDVSAASIADLDRDLLAGMALVDADNRSTVSGGRFSEYDVRAGAMRALSRTGIVTDRAVQQEVIEDITARAVAQSFSLLDDAEGTTPAHVKGFMSPFTAEAKMRLAAQFDALAGAGVALPAEEVEAVAGAVLDEGRTLDEGQAAAAAAIAGTDRLVTVTGPAGAGKTTLLRVARKALEDHGRQMIVVAPTKKAASVAAREVGSEATSLHALLRDHGWRWGTDDTGAPRWTQLEVGDLDPATWEPYTGPRRFPLSAGDRIVVDEAGMVDLHTAHALAVVAEQTGAGIAMVGDHRQAAPVGHSGAMAMLRQRASASTELTAVHRFRTADGAPDHEYAALSLRLREPGDHAAAVQVATELYGRGQLRRVDSATAARERMVDGYLAAAAKGRRVALVTGTNAEAHAINEAIQRCRLDAGELDAHRAAIGQDDQRILVGDIVQTRLNDRASGVENRALWTVSQIARDGQVTLTNVSDSRDTREVTAEYVADHVHLAYASTVHGIQGETTDEAIVGPGVDAAGLYVGMTRGKERNEAIVIAKSDTEARDALAQTMRRGQAEVSLADSEAAAREELSRAAREPLSAEDVARAAWDDREVRPLGTIVDLEAYTAAAHAKASELRHELEHIVTERAHVDASIQREELRLAAAGPDADTAATAQLLARLREQAERLAAERQRIAPAYARAARTVDAAPVEARVRAAQPEDVRERENAARVEHAYRKRFDARFDVAARAAWNDRERRPMGRVTDLEGFASQLAAKAEQLRERQASAAATAERAASRIAQEEARRAAQPAPFVRLDAPPLTDDALEQLRGEHAAAVTEREAAAAELARTQRSLDSVAVEAEVRGSQLRSQHREEDLARQAFAEERRFEQRAAARWDDWKRRPVGSVSDLDSYAARQAGRLAQLRAEEARLGAKRDELVGAGAAPESVDRVDAQRADVTGKAARIERRLEAVPEERRIREQQSDQVREREDAERAAADRERRYSTADGGPGRTGPDMAR